MYVYVYVCVRMCVRNFPLRPIFLVFFFCFLHFLLFELLCFVCVLFRQYYFMSVIGDHSFPDDWRLIGTTAGQSHVQVCVHAYVRVRVFVCVCESVCACVCVFMLR